MVMGSGFFDDYDESGRFKYPGGIPTEEDNPKNKKNGGKKVADNENERIQNTSSNGDDGKEKKKNGKKNLNAQIEAQVGPGETDVKEIVISDDGDDFDPNTVRYSELLAKIPEEFHRKNPDGQVMGHAANYNPFARTKESPHGRFYDPETKTSYALDADLKPDMDKPVFGSTGNYQPDPPDEPVTVESAFSSLTFTTPGEELDDSDLEIDESDLTLDFEGEPGDLTEGIPGLATIGDEKVEDGIPALADIGDPALGQLVEPVDPGEYEAEFEYNKGPDFSSLGLDPTTSASGKESGIDTPSARSTVSGVEDSPEPSLEALGELAALWRTDEEDQERDQKEMDEALKELSLLEMAGYLRTDEEDQEGDERAIKDAIEDEMAYSFEDGTYEPSKESLGELAALWRDKEQDEEQSPKDMGSLDKTEVFSVWRATDPIDDEEDQPPVAVDDPEQTSTAFMPLDQRPPSALNPRQLIEQAFLDEKKKAALIMEFRKDFPEFYDSKGNFIGGDLPGELGGERWEAYGQTGMPGNPQAAVDWHVLKSMFGLGDDAPVKEDDFVKAFLTDQVENEIFQDAVAHFQAVGTLSAIPGPAATIYEWDSMGPKMRTASLALDSLELLVLGVPSLPMRVVRAVKAGGAPTTASKIVAASTATQKYIDDSLQAYDAALGLTGPNSVASAVKKAETSKNAYIDALALVEDIKAHGRYPREAGAGYTAAGVISEAEYARRLQAAQDAVGFAAEEYSRHHDEVIDVVKASTNEFGEGGELANLGKGAEFPTAAENLLEIKNVFHHYVDVFPEVKLAAKQVDEAYDNARDRIAEYGIQGWEPGPSIAEPVKDILAAHKALRDANNIQATILKGRVKSLQDDLDAGGYSLAETHAVRDEIRSIDSQIRGLNALDGADLQKMDDILTDVIKTFKGEPEPWQIPVLLAHDAVTKNKAQNLKEMDILWAEGFDPDAPWGSGGKGPAIYDATRPDLEKIDDFDWGLGSVKPEGAGGFGVLGVPPVSGTGEAPGRWTAMYGGAYPELHAAERHVVKPVPTEQFSYDPSYQHLGELANLWSPKDENIGLTQPSQSDSAVAKDSAAVDVEAADDLVQPFPSRVDSDSSVEFEGDAFAGFGRKPFETPLELPVFPAPSRGWQIPTPDEGIVKPEPEVKEEDIYIPEPEPFRGKPVPDTIPVVIPPTVVPVTIPSGEPPPPDEGEEAPASTPAIITVPAPTIPIRGGVEDPEPDPVPEPQPIPQPTPEPVPPPEEGSPPVTPPEVTPSIGGVPLRTPPINLPPARRKPRKQATRKAPRYPKIVGWKQGKVYGYQDLVSGKSYYSSTPLYNKLPRGMNLKPIDTLQVVKRGSTRPRKRQFTLGDTVVRVGRDTLTFTDTRRNRRGRRA